ncbi:MAG: selenocysteine-specific translation elongation factor, partial [Acidobacteria bacterium]|nr:selenocysteine-specific translation elongation factor [Acidobacteriota bacterium]
KERKILVGANLVFALRSTNASYPWYGMRHVVVGTAGHIDHGKSALILALTGVDPDRLKEEKQRGITIDLGFAHLDMGDVQVGFVDVPGHEKFVKNMLAGAGGIDFVLLVVAADESIMPQTREHFDICRLLGVRSGIVVINKTDLVDSEMIELVQDEILEATEGSFLEGSEVIPVSARTGAGMDRLKKAIHDMALSVPLRPSNRLLRLPIDRSFSIRGFGTVVTGTLTSGEISKDQEVELIPGGLTARVRGVQVHGRMTGLATAGQRTAVNLQGVELAQVTRGMVITVPKTFRETQILDVRLHLLPSAKPLKNLIKVRFHQGTLEVLARVAFMGQDTLVPGEEVYAQLRLDAPVFCLHGDAFIIRQFSPAITIGGGRILHPHPSKHRSTDKDILDILKSLDRGRLSDKIPAFLATDSRGAMDLSELDSLLGLPMPDLRKLSSELAGKGGLVMIPAPSPILVLESRIESLTKETLARVGAFHKKNPLQKGISREELRKRIYDDMPAEVFRYCLEALVEARKLAMEKETVSLFGREVELSAEGERLRERIEAAYMESGMQPPSLSELQASMDADPDELRRIFYWMLKEQILIKISEDFVYHRSTLDGIKEKLRSRFAPGTKFGVADFKETLDLTRKHSIPLLEYLDREKFTRRQGNERILL